MQPWTRLERFLRHLELRQVGNSMKLIKIPLICFFVATLSVGIGLATLMFPSAGSLVLARYYAVTVTATSAAIALSRRPIGFAGLFAICATFDLLLVWEVPRIFSEQIYYDVFRNQPPSGISVDTFRDNFREIVRYHLALLFSSVFAILGCVFLNAKNSEGSNGDTTLRE